MGWTKAELRKRLDDAERVNRGLVSEVENLGSRLVAVERETQRLLYDLDNVCEDCVLRNHGGSCQCHTHIQVRKTKRVLG